MTDAVLLDTLVVAAERVRLVLSEIDDWLPGTERAGQYRIDVAADAVAVELLVDAGLGVLSEESGIHHPERAVTVVLDPVDGSTNASRGIPWYATSLCAVDAAGPRVALVVNQASGERFDAVRGGGARCDGRPVHPSGCEDLSDAIVCLSGYPSQRWGWRQFRALGAAALDLCCVADGRLDAFAGIAGDGLGPWDYLGALLVCEEAGAAVVDLGGRNLVVLDHEARRFPLAAANGALLAQLSAAAQGAADG
ncbi:MAG TPA: inositol monophosphatase family protein [Acidimicrobiales bacterium]|nr:inositol monophosphatase family protein [Acidimicrobiales bacterium]